MKNMHLLTLQVALIIMLASSFNFLKQSNQSNLSDLDQSDLPDELPYDQYFSQITTNIKLYQFKLNLITLHF